MKREVIKIVYVVGGLITPNGMSQVLSQKINYLAECGLYKIFMILTEQKRTKWCYEISDKVEFVNFDLNFDELDTMSFLKKTYYFYKKQIKYKKLFSRYLFAIRPDITVSTCRREINFINDIKDGSIKIGEIHFNKFVYRRFNKKYLPKFVNSMASNLWINSFIKQAKRLNKFVVLSEEDKSLWGKMDNIIVINNPLKSIPTSFSTCENKNVIAVGRYTYQKGFDLLFKSWKYVELKHPDWTLNIYGGGDYQYYQRLALEMGLTTVVCNPSVNDIYIRYRESSIFVLSSRYEGFALVLAEAMSNGLPEIAFLCPCGPREIIHNGIDGLLVDNGNIQEFASKINYLIENDDERKSMGRNARNNTEQYREEVIMQKWICLFNEVLKI